MKPFQLTIVLMLLSFPSGCPLKCHTCYSEKSWADCEEHQWTIACSALPEKPDVCARVTRSIRMNSGGQTITSFAKYCYHSAQCSASNCRQSHRHQVAGTWCEIECCNSTECDGDVAKATSGAQSKYGAGSTALVLGVLPIILGNICS